MKIAFIGFGQMGSALAGGIVDSGLYPASGIIACDVFKGARDRAESLGYSATENASDCYGADVIFLSVKPQQAVQVLKELSNSENRPLIISIIAGLEICIMEALLGAEWRIIRVMPNTPCLVKKSASAFSCNSKCDQADVEIVNDILSAVGICSQVPEKLLHAVTGVSGSGPAYFYLAIDALAESGVKYGLTRAQAVQLAAQTALGTAEMVLQNPDAHIMQLKDNVSSPGGTTIRATETLKAEGLPSAIHKAVDVCIERSMQLGEIMVKEVAQLEEAEAAKKAQN